MYLHIVSFETYVPSPLNAKVNGTTYIGALSVAFKPDTDCCPNTSCNTKCTYMYICVHAYMFIYQLLLISIANNNSFYRYSTYSDYL